MDTFAICFGIGFLWGVLSVLGLVACMMSSQISQELDQ